MTLEGGSVSDWPVVRCISPYLWSPPISTFGWGWMTAFLAGGIGREEGVPPGGGGTLAPHVHRKCTGNVQRTRTEDRAGIVYSIERREISLSYTSRLHQNRGTHLTWSVGVCGWGGVCNRCWGAREGEDVAWLV